MKSLLVIQPFALREIVHSLQVVQSLAWARPECRITWVVSEEYEELVRASPFVRETIVFRQKDGWRALLALRRRLQIKLFDAVWDMAGVLRSGLLTSAVLALEKWGRADARQWAGFFCNRRITAPAGTGPHHTLDILQPFLRAAGVSPRLYFPLELRPGQPFAWADFFIGDPRNTFVIFADHHKRADAWPYYSELTALIFDQMPGSRIVWCTTGKTRPRFVVPAARFLNIVDGSLRELIALVRQPAAYIGKEDGLMHLSAALGNPVLVLSATPGLRQTGPYPLDAAKHRVVPAPEGQLRKLQPRAALEALVELRQRLM
jgi:heptosyltransferase-2/heptosyltransferase I